MDAIQKDYIYKYKTRTWQDHSTVLEDQEADEMIATIMKKAGLNYKPNLDRLFVADRVSAWLRFI